MLHWFKQLDRILRGEATRLNALKTGAIDLSVRGLVIVLSVLVLSLHGGCAENGELQLMCEARGVPFTGSGSASSHLAFDKVAAKRFAAIAGVKAPT